MLRRLKLLGLTHRLDTDSDATDNEPVDPSVFEEAEE